MPSWVNKFKKFPNPYKKATKMKAAGKRNVGIPAYLWIQGNRKMHYTPLYLLPPYLEFDPVKPTTNFTIYITKTAFFTP